MAIIPSSNWALDEIITIPKINQNYYIQSVTNLPSTGKEGQDIVYCTSSGQFYLYYNSGWHPVNISGQIPIHGNEKHTHSYFYQESDLTSLLDDNYYPSSLGHSHVDNSDIHFTKSQIDEVGTVTSGTWNANPITQSYLASGDKYWQAYLHSSNANIHVIGTLDIGRGGTNNTSYTTGKFLAYDGSKIASTSYDNSSFASANHTHDASDIVSGTLSTDRFSAYSDLVAENKIGTGSDQVAAGNHIHDDRYYTESESNSLFFPSSTGHSHITNTSNPHSVTLEQARVVGNTLSGIVNMNGNRIINLSTPTDNSDAATKDYVDSKVQGLDWQDSVLDKDLTSPPSSPSEGDRYIVAANQPDGTASGDWSGHENDIAEWNDSSWEFTTPNKGFAVYVEDETKQYNWNGSSWIAFGSTIDHGNLVGLSDDDHPQYYNDSRLGTWWSGKTTDDLSEGSTNLYYTDERAQDAVGNILDDGSLGNIAFTYDNSTPKIYANLQSNEITISGNQVIMEHISPSTYSTLEDWFKTTQSTGKLTGGDITDNGDGTISVSAGTGIIKTSNSDTAETKFIDWSSVSNLSLTNNSVNYIYVSYNSGSPTVTASTSIPSDKNTNIILGLVYRDGTDLHIVTAGQVVTNYAKNTLWKDMEINGKFQRVSGLIISEKSDRKFAITAGTIYAALTKVNLSAFDSSAGDTFTYYWRDGSGGWNKSTGNTQIDNLHYDDGSGTLAELSNSTGWRHYYGVHWVYMNADGHVFVVYGRGNYLLSDAENAQPPSDIPPLIESMGGLVGKIIIEKNADSFENIQSAFEVVFTPATVNEHNLLGGLQGGAADEYYHLTEEDYNEATSFFDNGSTTHTQIDEHIASTQIHFKQEDITTVGSITAGEWRATPIAQSYIKSGSEYWNAYLHSANTAIHLTSTEKSELVGGSNTTLHYHAADRDLNNATGTLAIVHGGTNNTAYTTNKFIVFDGDKLSSSSYDASSFASASHTHDDRYYTKSESDSLFYPSSLGHSVNNNLNTHISNTNIHFQQSDITTVGTITTGVWHGSAIAQDYIKSGSEYWTAYQHSQITGNPHGTTLSDLGETKGDLSVTSPLSVDNTRQLLGGSATISIQKADSTHDGYLSSTDWSTFNNKQDAFTHGILSNGVGIQSFSVGVSGSNATISVAFGKTDTTVASGSHLHDDRYYTESESNSLFFPSSSGHSHITNYSNPHNVTYSQVGAIQDADNTVKENHIDWGTGTNQVSLDNIPDGNSYAKLTTTQKTDLTDGGDTTLHYHASDRDLSNATGTLTIDKGGTNNTSYTTNKFLVYDGSKITSSSYDSSSFASASHTHSASDITSGTLAHERGGLETDVSSYNGLIKIAGGSTSYIADNHTNWDSAYTHSTTTTGNPHHVTLEQARSQNNTLSGDINFNQHKGLGFVIETRTSDPSSPVVGQIWFRTDLA